MSITGLIILIAVVAIVLVALRSFGVVIPQAVLQILGIVAVAIVAIWAVRFILAGA